MPWFKVDDKFHAHRKRHAAGLPALGLWTVAGSWCADQLEDGRVPRHMLAALGGKPKDAAALVAAGLWTETPDGWQFHDWDHHNPTAAEVKADRAEKHEAKVRAGRAGGVASGAARRKHAASGDEAEAKQDEAEVLPAAVAAVQQNEAPTRPVPEVQELPSPPATATPLTLVLPDPFDEFWEVWPRKVEKKPAREAYKRALKKAGAPTILAAARLYAAEQSRKGTAKDYIKHAAAWLNAERWEDEQPEPVNEFGFREVAVRTVW